MQRRSQEFLHLGVPNSGDSEESIFTSTSAREATAVEEAVTQKKLSRHSLPSFLVTWMLFNAPRRVSVVTTVLLIVITVLFARRCCSNYNRPTSPARRAHSSKPAVANAVLFIVITFTFARRCQSNRLIYPARRRAHSSKPAVAGLLLWARAGTDTRTDSVPFHRPCCARTECWWTASAVVGEIAASFRRR